MTTLHLIRHGQTEWNLERRIQGQTESYLTEMGQQQAVEVAESLKAIPFTAAYSSSSVRAHDTAKAILNYHDVPLQLRDDMREIHLGHWEGHLYADIGENDEHMQIFRQRPADFKMPGAESFSDVRDRGKLVVNELLRDHPGQHVLLVSHGIWIKSILADIEQRPISDFWSPPQMGNCCHSIVEFDQDKAKIVQYAGLREW